MKSHTLLQQIRKQKGFAAAKEFFTYLQSRGLSCNYSHYMKLEQGKAVLTPQIVNEIARSLDEDEGNHFLLQYCREIFPQKEFLFKNLKNLSVKKSSSDSNPVSMKNQIHLAPGQKQLTLQQVAALSKTRDHYHLFILLTLARSPLSHEELSKGIKTEKLEDVLEALASCGLIRQDSDGVSMVNTDLAFPHSSEFSQLIKTYQDLDRWDREITEHFEFETLSKRIFLRRVSPRNMGLIQNHLELLFELIKSSDEADKKYNETVLQFNVQLKSGRMPG